MAQSVVSNNPLATRKPPHLRIVYDDSPNPSEANFVQNVQDDFSKYFRKLIKKEIKKALKKESRKSFWQTSIIAILLFLLGVIASLLIYVVSTLHK